MQTRPLTLAVLARWVRLWRSQHPLLHLHLCACLLICAGATHAQPTTQPTPRMGYLDNGQIRIGVDLNLGGAITWISKSTDTTNLVNNFDLGRQIQMSFYSGPI